MSCRRLRSFQGFQATVGKPGGRFLFGASGMFAIGYASENFVDESFTC